MTKNVTAIDFAPTAESFGKLIDSIVKAQARAAKDIGAALLMALYFANKEQDAGPANKLYGALRKSTKKAGIEALLQEHGNLALMTIGKKSPTFEFFDAKKVWDKEEVSKLRDICARWEDYKPAKEEVTLDVAEMLDKLLTKVESAKKNNKEVENFELAKRLAACLATYTAEVQDGIIEEEVRITGLKRAA